MKKDVLIGGAWPYANYFLHIGHLSALLPGDIIAKYYRGKGENVIYVSGSDCHGTPITERAKKENTTAEKIASFYHQEFVKTFDRLGFEYDKYASTMDPLHHKFVEEYFLELKKNSFIYEKEVPQDYCPECFNFLSDREIQGVCPHCDGKSTGDQCDVCNASLDSFEVLDKHCKNCGTKCITRNNNHLYFKLSYFQKDLQELIDKRKTKWRKNAVGEAQKFLDMGLVDRSATRQINWGIKVPVEGYDDKRIYVWIEAVLGYLSMAKVVAESRDYKFENLIANNNENLITYYVHGKDNIPFHTTIFPSLLLGMCKNYRLPDYIISSAYVNLNNEKMSKSKGNLITVNKLLDIFDRDTVRLYFSLFGPETNDINCSIDEIIQCHNKFLVGVLGNFVNRNLSFIVKQFDGKIQQGSIDLEIKALTKQTFKEAGEYIENGEIRKAITTIIEYISLGNKFYDNKQPWKQIKEDLNAFYDTTYTCIYMIANISNLILPFMPDGAVKIKEILNLSDYRWQETTINGNIEINNLTLLYTKLEKEKVQKIMQSIDEVS